MTAPNGSYPETAELRKHVSAMVLAAMLSTRSRDVYGSSYANQMNEDIARKVAGDIIGLSQSASGAQAPAYPVTVKPSDLLLPCPLCGEKRIFLNAPNTHHQYGSINCPACGLVLPGAVKDTMELISCWNNRTGGVAQAPPFTPELMNQTTVSCSGKEIAIQCNNHEVKDALMDILVDGAYARPSIPAQSQNNSQELTADQVAYCRENADATRARWREHAQAAPNRPPLDGEPEIDAWVRSLGWFPIDTAPKPNVDVLLWYPWIAAPRKDAPTGFAYIARWTGTDAGEDCWRDPADFEPIGEGATHWMPLPAPPSTLPSTNGGAAT